MRKLIKIGVVILLFIIGLLFNTKVNAEDNPEKGDLKCPSKYLNNGCVEIRDDNGRVTEVRVSTIQNGITITKYVRRTDVIGQYEVQFGVSGSGQVSSSKDAYVMLIIDASSSISREYQSKVVPAVKEFGQKLSVYSNVYLSFVAFNDGVTASRNFSHSNFNNVNFGNTSNKSYIYKAFQQANDYFSGKNGRKYVVIFGDGIYHSDDHPFESDWNKLDNLTDVNYSVDFCPTWEGCMHSNMFRYVNYDRNYYYWIGNFSHNYSAIFKEIAEQIGTDIELTCLSGTVTDTLGSHFSIVSGSRTYTFDRITSQGVLSDPFLIKIERSLENGWYPTNNGFNFRVEGDRTIESHIDPLVYWEQEDMEFNSCSDSISFTETDENDYGYFSINCSQGYGRGTTKTGYSAEFYVDDLKLTERQLNLGYGMGFTAKLNLKNNIKCVSNFDYQAFNKRLNEIQEQLNVLPENSNERANLLKELYGKDGKSGMIGENGVLNTYQKYINQKLGLVNEKDRFVNQTATMTIKDSSNGNIKQVNLINSSNISDNIDCSSQEVQIVYNKRINVKYTCTANFSKTMKLPETCLNMQSGEQEDCLTSSTIQITGGERFYQSLSTTHGYISLLIPSAGYFKNDIKLDGEKRDNEKPRCEFNVGKRQSFVYRQIELSDPFLQTYSKTRKVGNNWSNKTYNYNFQNIIDEKIWNKTFEFKYQLSKVNVENIKNTTVSSNERVNGYLGTNCYINNNNKYICPFVGRNESEVKDLFTKVFINE